MPAHKKRKVAVIAETESASNAVATPPAKRGRPSKVAKETSNAVVEDNVTTPVKRGRGRPSKGAEVDFGQSPITIPISTSVKNINSTSPAKTASKSEAVANTPLRRSARGPDAGANADDTSVATTTRASRNATNGNPNGTVIAVKQTKTKAKAPSTKKAASPTKTSPTKKGTRGVAQRRLSTAKSKGTGKGKAAAVTQSDTEDGSDPSPDDAAYSESVGAKAAKRGNGKARISVDVPIASAAVEDADDADEEDADEPNYWLMKAEPESRMEKGKDVKFSIDDLKDAKEPEAWDGVRNPSARNNMRAMLKGDKAFFYHSNCKIPGIAGIMEIVEEHTPDESAFDPKHPYYDPKSAADNPRWDKVRVEFRRKFPELIKLKELQKYAKEGGVLQKLQTLKLSRLSVSKVTKKEWDFIMSLVDDEDEIETEIKLDQPKGIDFKEDEPNAPVANMTDTNSNGAEELGASAFGPGEGGVADVDSNMAAAWKSIIN